MSVVAFLLCILVITVTAIYLYRKLNPQGVLMLAGLVMLTFALILNVQPIIPDKSTGSAVFDLVKVVEETFIGNLSRAGLMIMTIGGYVAFMNHIKATNALVHISMKPLGFFRRYPYLAATVTIPIGQLLFITTPSAAGLGLLLVASVYPVLIGLGVSRLTALSVRRNAVRPGARFGKHSPCCRTYRPDQRSLFHYPPTPVGYPYHLGSHDPVLLQQ